MADNNNNTPGPPDIAGSFERGMQAGNMLGDAIANYRYRKSMRGIQDDVDSGKYSSDEAGQQQLQTDIRKAAENSNLDTRDIGQDKGGGQVSQDDYQRLQGIQLQRQMQTAGNQIAAGNPGQGMTTAGNAMLNQGDLQQGIPLAQQGAVASANAGNAVDPQGNYIPSAGAQNTANVQGSYGNAAGANQASDDAEQRRQIASQQFAGRAAMAFSNPAMGGAQQGVAYLNTALTLSPMVNGIQVRATNDPNFPLATVDAKTGQPLGKFAAQDVQQFAQVVSQDPAKFMQMIQQVQASHAQNQYQQVEDNYKQAMQSVFKAIDSLASGSESVPSKALEGYQGAASGALTAAKAGVKLFSDTSVDKDNPQKNMMAELPDGRLMRITVNAPGVTDPTTGAALPPVTFSDSQNRTYTPQQLGLDGNTLQGIGQYAQGSQIASVLDSKFADHMNRVMTAIKLATDFAKQNASAIQGGQGIANMSGLGGQGGQAIPVNPANANQHQAIHQLENPSGDPNATSPKGATGVSQFEPETGKETQADMIEKGLLPKDTPEDAWRSNPAIGDYYFDKMHSIYESRYPGLGNTLAPMAYNWGTGNVDKWIAKGMPFTGKDAPPKETQRYVNKFLAMTQGGKPGAVNTGMASGIPTSAPTQGAPPVAPAAHTPENAAFNQWLTKGQSQQG